MTEATLTWSAWQALLQAFADSFTRRGFRRFPEWITAMPLDVEEHTITQSDLALDQPAAWKALETFAEYGGWHEGRVTYDLTRLRHDARLFTLPPADRPAGTRPRSASAGAVRVDGCDPTRPQRPIRPDETRDPSGPGPFTADSGVGEGGSNHWMFTVGERQGPAR